MNEHVQTSAHPNFEVDLGDVESPYPAESLSTTLDRVVEFNKRFIHHRHESSHWLVALWVASTHAMPVWDWHGRIYITAPQPGVGKSTQAEVMAMVCPNSVETASTSGPGLFRLISAEAPTMFIDEAESQFSAASGRDGDIVNQVINKGYKRGGVVTRSEGNVAVKHPVYAALCIIGIDNGSLKDTTRSRCIPLLMEPTKSGKRPEKFRPRRHEDFAAEMRSRFANHAHDFELLDLDPDEFVGRQSDLWESLYSVAVTAGPVWIERFNAAANLHMWPEDVSENGQVLAAIRDYFRDTGAEKVSSTALVAALNAREDLPHITSAKALSQVWLDGYRTADGQHIKAKKSNGVYCYRPEYFKAAFDAWFS